MMGATILGEMQLGQQERAGPSLVAGGQTRGVSARELGKTILLQPEPHREDCHAETGTPNSFVMAEDQDKGAKEPILL